MTDNAEETPEQTMERLREAGRAAMARLGKSPSSPIESVLPADAPWEAQAESWKQRRLMLAAAYIAGASLRQLGYFEGIKAPTVKELVIKEIPLALMKKVGSTRIGKSRAFGDEQVEAGLAWFKLNRPDGNIVIIASRMREVMVAAGDNE